MNMNEPQSDCTILTHLDPIIFLDDSPSYSSLLSVAAAANVGDDGDDGGGSVDDDVCVPCIDNGHKTVSAAAINNSVVCILFLIFCSLYVFFFSIGMPNVVVVVARSLQNTIKQVKVKENHGHILLRNIHRLNLRLQISMLGEKK